ncbi:MAG: hypothetical protein ACP5JM_01450 [Thermoplasmata archaeon]|jgi:DNA repair exonuclease SbcCD ATPase subunit
MLSKNRLTEDLERLSSQLENLSREIEELRKRQDEISRYLEELEQKISFLNVLSAKINTTYYHITYEIDDKFKNFLSEIKDYLIEITNQLQTNVYTVEKETKKKKASK